MNWYLKALKQYADFSGRARRKEFWIFYLVNILISWALSILDFMFSTYFFTIVSFVYSLAVFIPTIASGVRRLHDIGKSGAYILLIFLPLIGWIWLLILLCMEGESKPNHWGEDPKGAGNDFLINQIGTE